MTIGYVVMQNLRRNPVRTALTVTAFALPMAVFVTAFSFVVVLARVASVNEKALRLAVHHKVSMGNLLPAGMRRKIEALDPDRSRLVAVCGMRWFGGRVPNTPNTLESLATDVDTFPTVYSEVRVTEDEVAAWRRERKAAVVGRAVAERYGWKPGDRIVLESTVYPYVSMEFRIVKIVTEPDRVNYFFLRLDYLEEGFKAVGYDSPGRNVFWVKCQSAAALRSLQSEIDALFANSPEETKSEDENALMATFTQAAGDIPSLMKTMAMVVVLIIGLVAGNTMMMSFRERTRELGVFKAIGFPSGRIFLIVLGESLLLAMIGSLLGIVPTTAALIAFPARGLDFGPISALEVSPLAVVGSLVIALLVGLAAGVWPAYKAMRLRTTDALRRVA